MAIRSTSGRWGVLVLAALTLLALTASAGAVQLVDFTIETDKAEYQLGESVWVTYHVYNAGNEDLEFPYGPYWPAAAAWLFENAAELSRDDLLSTEQPIWTVDLSMTTGPLPPGYADTTGLHWPQHDDLGNPVGPGKYTFVGLDGPYPWAWEGATVDYSNAVANITIVPEPGMLCLLLGAAAAGILRKAKRRRT